MRRFWMLGVLATALCFTTAALAQGTTTDPLSGTTETAATDPAITEPTVDTDPLGGSLGGATDTVATEPEQKEEPKADDAPPQPKDRTGSFGLGVEGTMGFRLAPSEFVDSSQSLRLPALSIIYPASPLFHFQVLAGAILAVGSGAPAGVQLGLTLRGIYLGLILSESVTLTIPFGLGYTIVIGPDPFSFPVVNMTTHYFHLEAGLRPEWFITDYISVHTQAGAVFSLLTANQGGGGSGGASYDPGVGINLFANTNLMAQAGFTVWFN